jgi:acyl-CoA thioesterase
LSPHAFETSLSLSGADGQYELELDRTWEGQPGAVWGGFLLAVVLRAAGLTATVSRPVSAASQFLRPAAVGQPLDINVVSLRRGRTSELLAVSVGQAGRTVVEAQIRASEGGSGPVCEPRQPPTLVDPLSRPLAGEATRADGTEAPNILGIWDMRAPEFGDATAGDPEACFWGAPGAGSHL